jgi:glycosyltransferase involved in cell wall biosynthesis
VKGLDNFEIILIGKGNDENNLKELANKKNVKITFLEYVKHSDIPKMYLSADVFVLPSLNEGMSNSMLEAMACGLPIISTDTGGARKLIGKTAGFIVEKESASSIRKALCKYAENPGLIGVHGKNAREKVKNMSWSNVAKKYFEVYKKIK